MPLELLPLPVESLVPLEDNERVESVTPASAESGVDAEVYDALPESVRVLIRDQVYDAVESCIRNACDV